MRTSLLVVAGVFACASPASAQLIAYDPFNQGTGLLDTTASSGGGAVWPSSSAPWHSGFSGDGGVVEAGNLSYGPLSGIGNRVRITDQVASPVGSVRSLGSNRGGGGSDLWLSFMMVGDLGGRQHVALYNDGQAVAYFGTTQPLSTAPPFGMSLFPPANSATGSVQYALPAVFADGSTTHFVAVHLQLGAATNTNTVTMYVDPDIASLGTGSGPTGGSSVSYSEATDFAFNQIVVGNFSTASSPSVALFDEIRFGESWVAVSSITPVPEPAGLLLAGVVGGVVRRKRRAHRV